MSQKIAEVNNLLLRPRLNDLLSVFTYLCIYLLMQWSLIDGWESLYSTQAILSIAH